ncbi:anthranilate phosphoribosyltransferase [Buchnera aphidicola]|uniref:anthranilate phosphoribosyltransferase n=1 Tax=Buchnera aphidicola TaxID=9 RepID=UPI0020924359|nr:anthranilate phosphoribosyltransferase [Buchnera aphidicola]USS94316.1 anthranilate phosphoribosyltransferase [Buchnera aphidicola (Sipha maydis)]WII23475.1 anthranilate phosphoribosyltransferase [Buchnera aphidicola (Sipha maydis)]
MKTIIQKLYKKKNLQISEMYKIISYIGKKKISNIEISSIITAIKIKGLTKEEILGTIKACLKMINKFHVLKKELYADIVGTGGDYNQGINISTSSALVASLLGFKIIKHCNESVTSISGSSNILEMFNINSKMSKKLSQKILEKFNICFLHAQKYNPVYKNVKKVRSQLKTRTFFNLTGPLLNPSQPKLSVIGVYSKKKMILLSNTIRSLNYKNVLVINSDHTDEATLHDITYVTQIRKKKAQSYILTPEDFGIKWKKKNILKKQSLNKNFLTLKKIFKGKGTTEQNEIIAINTALLLFIFGKKNLKKNTQNSLDIIKSGKIYKLIKKISKIGSLCKKQS